MCIIIYRPADAKAMVSHEVLARCATSNPDGFGLMWSFKGRLFTSRYIPGQRKQFFRRFLGLQSTNTPFVAHFRYATHGGNTRANTHPYVIHHRECALMHNGILSYPTPEGWSDTRTFVVEVLRKLPKDWWEHPHLRWLILEATSGSKLAIMHSDGKVNLLHEKAGIWEDGIWYSNAGFRAITSVGRSYYNSGAYYRYDDRETTSRITDDDWERAVGLSRATDASVEAARAAIIKPPPTHVIPAKFLPVSKSPSKLYRWDSVTICEDCLRMEVGAVNDAILIEWPSDDEECELCVYHQHDTRTYSK